MKKIFKNNEKYLDNAKKDDKIKRMPHKEV